MLVECLTVKQPEMKITEIMNQTKPTIKSTKITPALTLGSPVPRIESDWMEVGHVQHKTEENGLKWSETGRHYLTSK